MKRFIILVGGSLSSALAVLAATGPALAAPLMSPPSPTSVLAAPAALLGLVALAVATLSQRRWEILGRFMMLVFGVSAVFAVYQIPALAQAATGAVVAGSNVANPGVVPTTTGSSVVVLPYGEWLVGAQSILTTILTFVITAVAAWLPMPIRWLVNLYGADRIAKDAVNFAIAATPGASRDAKLEVNVGSQVLKRAIDYVLENSSKSVIKSLGGPEGIANKLIGLIPLHEDTTAGQVKTAAGLGSLTGSVKI